MAHNHGKKAAVSTMKHAQHIAHHGLARHEVSNTLIKGAVMSAGAQTGKTIMSKITKHPLLLIGIGVVAGYYAHKYRKEIISSVTSVGDKGKDFVLQQKENLEDMVAESKEDQE
ncbi:hypothetical protein BJAS_P2592 [Bathymodiolus japonicus methanotrophic gill symbiont]|nr:hypothetical protein BJAS_P2592 [Bathymodiolus japonicus methanotrophic gill symbiont]